VFYNGIKRVFDLTSAVILLLALIIPMIIIALLVKATSKGPFFYWSDRVGKDNTIFKMPKFRTMWIETPAVATHLLKNPDEYLTPIGLFLRKLSLDELPQLWSVLKGDMSFVGPRPALFNQDDLIALRTEKSVHRLIPGITPVKWSLGISRGRRDGRRLMAETIFRFREKWNMTSII
jgi:O-antigen biosynthesis protein WbqP